MGSIQRFTSRGGRMRRGTSMMGRIPPGEGCARRPFSLLCFDRSSWPSPLRRRAATLEYHRKPMLVSLSILVSISSENPNLSSLPHHSDPMHSLYALVCRTSSAYLSIQNADVHLKEKNIPQSQTPEYAKPKYHSLDMRDLLQRSATASPMNRGGQDEV